MAIVRSDYFEGCQPDQGGVTDQGQDKNEFTGLNTRSAKDWEVVKCFSAFL
jgi:hypothetical protein